MLCAQLKQLAFRSLWVQGARCLNGAVPLQLRHVLTASAVSFQPAGSWAGYATGTQQLVRVQQQQQQHEQQSGGSSSKTWGKLLAAGTVTAGAAAAAWTWSGQSSKHAASQQYSHADGGAAASPRAQAVLVSCFAGPLLHLLQGISPSEPQLRSMANTLVTEAKVLTPWELVDGIWGLAMFNASLNSEQLQILSTTASKHLQDMALYEAIVAAWSLLMLSVNSKNSSSGSGSSSTVLKLDSAATQAADNAWQQLLQRLQNASDPDLDEASVLYLLHAAVQRAASRPVISAAVSPVPRASEAEVLQEVKLLPKWLKAKVQRAYREYVPFQHYIEGPYMIILHIAKSLPGHLAALQATTAAASQAAAAAAATTLPAAAATGAAAQPTAAAMMPQSAEAAAPAQKAAAAPYAAAAAAAVFSTPYAVAFAGLTAAEGDAASTVVSDPGTLGKLRRDLFYRWRSDELLDRQQKNLNQIVYVLQRRLGLPLQQPPDIDLVLPTLRAVILLDDNGSPSTATPDGSASSGHDGAASGNQPAQKFDIAGPYSAPYWAACHDALLTLQRNGYSAPPGGFIVKTTEGLRMAKTRCLKERGWQVVSVTIPEVEASLQLQPGKKKTIDYAPLERLLTSRLGLSRHSG